MYKSLVVMLGHQAHVGKDLLGSFLIERDNFMRFAFADKLKEVVSDLYGFSKEQMYGSLKNEPDHRYIKEKKSYNEVIYYTPREILQDFGQEQRLRFPDIWADYVCRKIYNVISNSNESKKFVITDFRFPNEYHVCKNFANNNNMDLITVKLIRPDKERGDFVGSTNISEIALSDFNFDFIINNDGSKEDLYNNFCKTVFLNYQ